MIYTSLLIPLITVIFLSIKFPKKVTFLERFIVFVVPIIAIIISKIVSTSTQTRDTEYWNSYVVKAVYYEFWNEWIEEQCCASYDSTGDCESWYDCSYCEDHPPYWEITDNLGKTYNYDQQSFEKIAKIWENRTFKEMHRDYHTIDGDAYITVYDNIFEHTVPICKQHIYENRIQCSKSVMNFDDLDTAVIKQYGLFNYPEYHSIFNYNPIQGITDRKATERLRWYNAHLGKKKQVHMMILIFHNQPIRAAILQEHHWKRGNKNEFILCIGRKNGKTTWAKVISWTDIKDAMVRVARKAREMEFDMVKIVDMMADEVDKHFVRKQFADFSYIRVEPTTTAILITFLITVLVTAIISIIIIKNEFTR